MSWACQLAAFTTNLQIGSGGLSDRTPDYWSVFAQYNRITTVFYALYPLEVLLLTAVKAAALDRMIDFVESQFTDAMRARMRTAKIIVLGVIVAGNLVGVAAGFASIASQATRVKLELEISRAYEGNHSTTPLASLVSSDLISSLAAAKVFTDTAGSVQEFSEV